MSLSKSDLSYAEIDCAKNGYTESDLKKLHDLYKKYRQTSEEEFKKIEIVIPIADRIDFLRNLLNSITGELDSFGFPSDFIHVSIINDSALDIKDEDIGEYGFKVKIRI